MPLTLERAQDALAQALQTARELEFAVAVVVVDDAGHIVTAARMDGVSRVVLDLATRKARTAAAFGTRIDSLVADMSQDPLLSEALATSPDLLLLPGGSPLPAGGAIGVGGAHYREDQEIANRAAAAQRQARSRQTDG